MKQRGSRPNPSDHEPTEVVSWRRQRLLHAGFDVALAEELACDRRFDLHAVLELLDKGCPPELAARILAPLEERSDGC